MSEMARIYRRLEDGEDVPELTPQGAIVAGDGSHWVWWDCENELDPPQQGAYTMTPPRVMAASKPYPAAPAYTLASAMFTVYGVRFRTDVVGEARDGQSALHDAYMKWCLEAKPNDFVEDYATTIDDVLDGMAPIEFQEGLACMLLSLLLTPRVGLYTAAGVVHTNLYMMLLGESSTTYKTSSMRKMREIVKAVEVFNGVRDGVVGMKNFTAESFPRWMASNAGRMIFSYEDEADGFIGQAQNKTYLRGVLPMLTDIYTSNSVEASRMQQDKARREDIATRAANDEQLTEAEREELKDSHVALLNCLWGGTPSAVLDSMSKSMFDSGFLPRFSFVIGHPKPFNPDKGFIRAAKPGMRTVTLGDGRGMNPEIRAFAEAVASRALVWQTGRPGETHLFSLSEEAAMVANQWDGDVMGVCRTHFPALTSAQSRTRMIALKLATLFAAWRGDAAFELSGDDMRQGIRYAMKWFMNSRDILDSLSETTFGVLQARIETAVAASENGVDKKDLAKNFERTCSRQDFQMAIKALSVDQDVITSKIDPSARSGARWVLTERLADEAKGRSL